jgi:hypothetical protein
LWQDSLLENGPGRAHTPEMTEFVEWLTGTHTCTCGAKYKVTVTKGALPHVSCEKCGVMMDHPTHKSFLAYERITGDL